MKRNMQMLLLVLFVFTITACIPVPVAVSPQSAGYDDQYGYGYDEYGSGYNDEYVDVPIAYGEPYYFAPPIVVTYPYDYYTYEMVGGFVDIVFWRGGHRYRHERWNERGRFVSDADMRSRQRHQRTLQPRKTARSRIPSSPRCAGRRNRPDPEGQRDPYKSPL